MATDASILLVLAVGGTFVVLTGGIDLSINGVLVFSGVIAAGSFTNVTVKFSPTAVSNYSGTVTVNSDALSGTNTIAASGTGAGALIALSGNLSFGGVPVNT